VLHARHPIGSSVSANNPDYRLLFSLFRHLAHSFIRQSSIGNRQSAIGNRHSFIRHSSFVILHSAFCILHSSFLMDIARQRLTRTLFIAHPLPSSRQVVHKLGAVQAQDYDGAKWALSQRTVGLTDAALEQDFANGEMIRTHVLRPTWHFVDPVDLRWMLALTGPVIKKRMAAYDRQLELDDKAFRRSNACIERALSGGKHLTRNEIRDELTRAKLGRISGQRLAHIMMRAELEALACSGPRRGKQFTYALVDERVAATPPMERDQAILELTLRYFRTRSPATGNDFCWWSGLPMADVRRGIEMARGELESVTIGEKTYWTTGQSLPRARPSAHLLPNYDEFFIGYRDRSAIGLRLNSTKVVTGGNALISNVVVVDGQLVGGWRRSVGSDTVTLKLELLTRLAPAESKRVRAEVNRYSSFIGRPVAATGLEGKR
jgi:hypothetical protein